MVIYIQAIDSVTNRHFDLTLDFTIYIYALQNDPAVATHSSLAG
jgi:hypothetical protein